MTSTRNSNSHPDWDNFEVDFSSPFTRKRGKDTGARDRAERTEYGNVDLATGFPTHLIWTTKDGQRIPIPMMTDSHLLNTIAYLRRRVEDYRKMVIADLAKGVATNISLSRMFDLPPQDEIRFEEANQQLKDKAKEVFNMSQEEILLTFTSRYKHLYNEAYKRKILIEVDNRKLT